MSSSCSFRITRTAEDLAQTISAISQRLVCLEQRIDALEIKSKQTKEDQSAEEMIMLDGVDQLLEECKGLLRNSSNQESKSEELWAKETLTDEELAA